MYAILLETLKRSFSNNFTRFAIITPCDADGVFSSSHECPLLWFLDKSISSAIDRRAGRSSRGVPVTHLIMAHISSSVSLIFERSGNAQMQQFDLIIEGGFVVDGTGSPGTYTDVGITDGRVVELGSLQGKSASERIDAKGKICLLYTSPSPRDA